MMPIRLPYLVLFFLTHGLICQASSVIGQDTFKFANRTYKLRRDSKGLRAQNLKNRTFGIITGTIVVTLKNSGDFESFTKTTHWKIKSSASQINTVFVEVNNLREPLIEVETIQNDPRVISAELEVIERKLKIK